MQCDVEIDQMNIERDKSGGVGQIPELRRGSLVAALSHLSVREGGRGTDWTEGGGRGGRVRSTIDNIGLPRPISSVSKDYMEYLLWNLCLLV